MMSAGSTFPATRGRSKITAAELSRDLPIKNRRDKMDTQQIMDTITTTLTTVGLKILGAIAVWIVGRWLIGLAVRLLSARADQAAGRSHAAALHRQHRQRRAERRAGRRHPRLLRRRDHLLRRAGRRDGHRHRRGLGRAAVQLRGRRLPDRAAAVQGRRLHQGRRRRRHGRWKSACSPPRSTRPDNVFTIVGNNKIFSRQHPELLDQRLPPRRPHRAARARRRTCTTRSSG